MKKTISIASGLAVILILAACGLSNFTKDFNGKIATVNTTATAVVEAAGDLSAAQKLSVEDYENVVDQAENIQKAAVIARSVHALDPEDGDARADAALVSIQALKAYLEEKEHE